LCLSSGDCGGGTCNANNSLCPGGSCGGQLSWPKNRFIGVQGASASTAGGGEPMGLRVTLVDIAGNSNCNGQVRWAGPPASFREGANPQPTFQGSRLQAEPFFGDFAGVLVQLYGEEVVPGSRYEIQAIFESCDATGADESCFSAPLVVQQAKWGDVITPLAGFTAATEPSIADVSSLVDKFRGVSGAPVKARAKLAPQAINPSDPVDFVDIPRAVDAFRGRPYPFTVTTCD
jgi:hypothetical protein